MGLICQFGTSLCGGDVAQMQQVGKARVSELSGGSNYICDNFEHLY